MTSQQYYDIIDQVEEGLSPALLPYTRESVSLASALTNQRRAWAGNWLYVEELKGALSIKIGSDQAFAIPLREGDVIKGDFSQVYLTTTGNSVWGTASILVGKGEFALEAANVQRIPVVTYVATGSGAIALSTSEGRRFKLLRATVHFNAAPTTSEDLTLTENANAGAAYDTVLESVDPSVGAVTDIVITPDGDWVMEAGSEIDLSYMNTDGRTFGAQIVVTPA